MRSVLARVVGATALVAALGAGCGAVGGLALAAVTVAADFALGHTIAVGHWGGTSAALLRLAAAGALSGAVLGPLFAWTLLRRAPVWRAVAETALAAALGTGVAISIAESAVVVIMAAVGSGVVAAVRLRRSVDRTGQIIGPSVAS